MLMYYGFKTAASGTHRCSFRATNNMIRTKNETYCTQLSGPTQNVKKMFNSNTK